MRRLNQSPNRCELELSAAKVLEGTQIGDSIAVNGVCLTVIRMDKDHFTADVMPETLRRSNLGAENWLAEVNLERAMAADGRFGGHIVAGHIDGTGTIRSMQPEGNAVLVTISAAPELLRYVVEKGSIAIDGISLTVAKVSHTDFTVSLIPHTGEETTLLKHRSGEIVNLETDIIGKYVGKADAAEKRRCHYGTAATERIFLKEIDICGISFVFTIQKKKTAISATGIPRRSRSRRHFLCPHGTVHDVPESPAISGYRNCTADSANRQPRQGQGTGAKRPELCGLPVECSPAADRL